MLSLMPMVTCKFCTYVSSAGGISGAKNLWQKRLRQNHSGVPKTELEDREERLLMQQLLLWCLFVGISPMGRVMTTRYEEDNEAKT